MQIADLLQPATPTTVPRRVLGNWPCSRGPGPATRAPRGAAVQHKCAEPTAPSPPVVRRWHTANNRSRRVVSLAPLTQMAAHRATRDSEPGDILWSTRGEEPVLGFGGGWDGNCASTGRSVRRPSAPGSRRRIVGWRTKSQTGGGRGHFCKLLLQGALLKNVGSRLIAAIRITGFCENILTGILHKTP